MRSIHNKSAAFGSDRVLQCRDSANALGSKACPRTIGATSIEGDTHHCRIKVADFANILDIRGLVERRKFISKYMAVCMSHTSRSRKLEEIIMDVFPSSDFYLEKRVNSSKMRELSAAHGRNGLVNNGRRARQADLQVMCNLFLR